MQSWNSKGMESINEVKVKAPGVEREEGQEVLWTMGTEILVRSFNSGTAWAGLRSETVEDMRVELQRWTAERFGQFHGQGQEVTKQEKKTVWLLEGRGRGCCVLTVHLAFILKWSWSLEVRGGCLAHAPGICSARQLKVGVVTGEEGGQAEEMKRNNDRAKRVRRLAPGTGRSPARRGRASHRRTDSWCSACSPPGSSHLSPGGQTGQLLHCSVEESSACNCLSTVS